jgi:hypothetical protein
VESAVPAARSADGPMVDPATACRDYSDEDPAGPRAVVLAAAGLKGYEDPPVDAAVDPERLVSESAARSVPGKRGE